MRLEFVEIRDYRSIFVDDGGQPFRLDLADGANTLVGQNNCGKSNVLRAISLALDPSHQYDPDTDRPGPRPFAHPSITLGFAGDRSHPADAEAIAAAEHLETKLLGTAGPTTRASEGRITLRVSFVEDDSGVHRQERILSERRPHDGVDVRDAQREAIAALRSAVRFVLISSGESIQSVLEGNFREILHSVVRDRLRQEFEGAERSRQEYVSGLQESLLRPLRERLASDVGQMFPEIDRIGLTPDVSSIENTLSNVEVILSDIVDTPLSGKGTGVRGGVLVAMLSYLAVNATRNMIFAVEEPEAFLHPASQEDLRDQLEQVAAATGISLLVTTHSPFLLTRSPNGAVFCIAKDTSGRTRVAERATGDEDHAPLIGDLLRDSTIESLLEAGSAFPPNAAAVVLVEGDGDQFCLQLAAELVGLEDLLSDLVIRPTRGTIRMIAQAVITRAATDLPVLLLTDNDEAGRKVKATLKGQTFEFPGSAFVNYVEVFDGSWQNFAVEAEDLFEPILMDRFVQTHGESIITGKNRRPDGEWHYDLDQAAKEELTLWLKTEARPQHVVRWVDLILRLRKAANLPCPDATAEELVEEARLFHELEPDDADGGDVMILTGQHDYARYLSDSALVLDHTVDLDDGVRFIGFYSKGIQREIPAIIGDYPGLLFDDATVAKLESTGKEPDLRAAKLVESMLRKDPELVGRSWRLLLLSKPNAAETVLLDEPIVNAKTINGRPVAWTVTPKVVPLDALLPSPPTTEELDAAIEALEALEQGLVEMPDGSGASPTEKLIELRVVQREL